MARKKKQVCYYEWKRKNKQVCYYEWQGRTNRFVIMHGKEEQTGLLLCMARKNKQVRELVKMKEDGFKSTAVSTARPADFSEMWTSVMDTVMDSLSLMYFVCVCALSL